MAFTYAYTPPTGMEPLPTPTVGATGHFDHHDALDEKINNLSAHITTQFGILAGTLSAEFAVIEAPVLDFESAISAVSAVANAALPKAGGTMSGAIAMGGSKITGLAAGDANGDAVRYEQFTTKLDSARVISGKVSATTNASGQITFTVPTSPTGNWAVTITLADTDVSLLNGLTHFQVLSQTSTSVTVRCANASDPAKAPQDNKALKFFYTAVAY